MSTVLRFHLSTGAMIRVPKIDCLDLEEMGRVRWFTVVNENGRLIHLNVAQIVFIDSEVEE